MASYHDETGGASGSSGLRRGEACTNCRHRKIRCDGVKPICGPCSQSTTGRWEVCDFVPYSRTATRVLKEQIENLEAHIEQLQLSKSSNSDSSVQHRQSSSQGTSLPPASARPSRAPDVSSTHATHRAWLSAFFARVQDLHFFLDIPRFRASLQNRSPAPSSALLDVIYLWGARCASELTLEASLLSRARQSVATAPTTPDVLLHTLQARLLLGQYAYGLDKSVEAGYYLNGAWSLALAAGLHRQRDVDQTRSEVRERINAFWHTLILVNLWSGVEGAPASVSYSESADARIYTPWPGASPSTSAVRRGTLLDFLDGRADGGSESLNYLAMASVVFERCTSVRTAAASGELSDEQLASQIHALDDVIAHLGPSLPSLPTDAPSFPTGPGPLSPSDAVPLRAALLTHTTLRVAVIQLHAPMADMSRTSRERRAGAARAVARMAGDVNVTRLGHVSPVMAALWATACHALIDELTVLRASNRTADMRTYSGALAVLEEALGTFAPRCSLYESRLSTIRQVRAAVGI
ncbi:hypothetical protein BD626DRAFT_222141 [Schizophyllum amplum]|uniref:Zn(2)-C6 fungal-type domain-containing protein n=1 Tax=Schizophyllum amplum TaxID=97359 RepID=A0A550BXG5_9AGAR|nr:hypothetical protein BD626DRAFT_222141 [Auriculariopsis ampla]